MSRLTTWAATAALLLCAALASQTLLVLLPLAVVAAFATSQRLSHGAAAWPAWLLMLVLAVVNSQKWPESDLADYYRYVDHVVLTPLWQVFVTDEAFVSIDPSEVLFKAFVALLSPLGSSAKIAFTAGSTLVVYGTCMTTSGQLLLAYDRSLAGHSGRTAAARPMALTLCAAVLVGITFSVTAHLTRQYLAGAVFFAGLFLYLLRGRLAWLIPCLLSVLVHRSAVILAPPLLLLLLHQRFPRLAWLGVVLIAAVGLFNPLALFLDLELEQNLLAQEGQQGPMLIALDALLVIGATRFAVPSATPSGAPATMRNSAPFARTCVNLAFFAAAFAAMLFATREVPLVLFRSYFYLEFIRVPLLAMVFHTALNRLNASQAAAVGLVVVGCLVCWARTANSEWEYTERGTVPWQLSEIFERWRRIEDNG